MPSLYILAGPNGAGKTTAAQVLLPEVFHVREFVNADEIARGLSPFNVEGVAVQAGKLMLNRMKELTALREEFVFETTLASKTFTKDIRDAQAAGYEVHLFFLWLPSPEISMERVAKRVARGGHHIPEDVIRRRYTRGIANLKTLYMPLVNRWAVYNNMEKIPAPIADMTNGRRVVYNEADWRRIMGEDA